MIYWTYIQKGDYIIMLKGPAVIFLSGLLIGALLVRMIDNKYKNFYNYINDQKIPLALERYF